MTLDELLATDRAVLHATEVASLLEVDERTISRAIAAGLLPGMRVGRTLRVPVQKLIPLLTDVPTSANDDAGGPHPRLATTEPATEEQAHDQHVSIRTRLAAVQ